MKKLNKRDLVRAISKKTGSTDKATANHLNAFVDVVENALSKGRGVQLVNFGSFVVRHREARMGRNPQTGKPIRIAAHNVPQFHSGKRLKNVVRK